MILQRLDSELEQTLLGCCRCLVATDGHGEVAWTAGSDTEDSTAFGTRVDLISSAVRRLGQDRGSADFETVFVRFDGELLLVVAVHGGHLALLAEPDVTPGLLFSYVRRVQLAMTEAA